MRAFWLASFIVFVAEMGDKTQIMTLTFSTRYRPRTVLVAVTIATLLIHLVSVVVGSVLGRALPLFWINLVAGVVFIAFGLWSLRDEGPETENTAGTSRFGPLVTIGTTFFLAEIGDRTMLATVIIAGREHSFFGVWFGSTVGMVLANMIAIVVGRLIGKKMPERLIKYGTVAIFIISGVLAFVAAYRQH